MPVYLLHIKHQRLGMIKEKQENTPVLTLYWEDSEM